MGPIITLKNENIIESRKENLNLVNAIPKDINTKKIVAYVRRKVVFSRNNGVLISKNRKKTETIIAYTGGLLIRISNENFFFC